MEKETTLGLWILNNPQGVIVPQLELYVDKKNRSTRFPALGITKKFNIRRRKF
jgi:hypothetical protein